MSAIKTTLNNNSVSGFLDSVPDIKKRQDSYALLEIFKRLTKDEPKMWGSSIIGFGSYHYKSERSRQEGDWPITGFSPRKQALTLYIMRGFDEYATLLKKLGKFKTSVSCLYVKNLEDINLKVLEELIAKSIVDMKKRYPAE